MQVKIALCQLDVGTDKQANIQTATKAVQVRHTIGNKALMGSSTTSVIVHSLEPPDHAILQHCKRPQTPVLTPIAQADRQKKHT